MIEQHTGQTPWRKHGLIGVRDVNGNDICICYPQPIAGDATHLADHVIKCVNERDSLMKIARVLATLLQQHNSRKADGTPVFGLNGKMILMRDVRLAQALVSGDTHELASS